MRALYRQSKYRFVRLMWLALILVFFATFTILAAVGFILSFKQPGFMSVFALAMVGVGIWGVFWHARYYLRTPREVSLLDGGQVQFLTRDRVETVSSGEFKAIRFVSNDESEDYLRVKAGAKTWYLPAKPEEAEEFIRTMSTLNPDIRVERK